MLELETDLQVDSTKENHKFHESVYCCAGGMLQVVDMLYTMSVTACSEIFVNSWKFYLPNPNIPMKFTDIETVIWNPAIRRCEEQLEKFRNLSFTFKELEEEFHYKITDPSHIMTEVENLVKGFQLCKKHVDNKRSLIKDVGKCIDVYARLVQSYKTNAEFILQDKRLKDMLGKYDDLAEMVKVCT